VTQRSRSVRTFGDFQTPDALASLVVRTLVRRGVAPRVIVEPTCGEGAFLRAGLAGFVSAENAIGIEIDPTKAKRARAPRTSIVVGNVFSVDFEKLLRPLPDPLLLLGNPPWVTNAALGALGSDNRPARANDERLLGLAAKTGKSNFDLAEWILLHLLDAVVSRDATLSFLCKTTTARRVLHRAWKRSLDVREATLHRIDAQRWFGAAVDACLFTLRIGPADRACAVFDSLEDDRPRCSFGMRDDVLVADLDSWGHSRHLRAREAREPTWRSGIKHDCAKVMEIDESLRARLDDDVVFPMLKGGELDRTPTRSLIVPQKTLGEDTGALAKTAPRTWAYLVEHGARLDRRASSIYRNRPRFSVFGVGPYTFSPWKIAISALHKRLMFHVVGPHRNKPVVFDDTVYFLPCRSKQEAHALCTLLRSEPAQSFYRSLVFWDAKRPITAEILRQLDLRALRAKPRADRRA